MVCDGETALRAATARLQRPNARTGWSSGRRMGCAAARRRPTAIPSAWRSRDGRSVVCHAEGAGGGGSGALSGEHDSAAGGAGALCRGRCGPAGSAGMARCCALRRDRVHFEFDYAGLSFVAPQKVRYRYMLEGFDRRLDGGRRAAHRVLHEYSAGAVYVSRAGGEQRRRVEHAGRGAARLNCGRISTRRSGFTFCCWRRLAAWLC